MDTPKRRSNAVVELEKAVKDQWGNISRVIDCVPAGWDWFRPLAARRNWKEKRAKEFLKRKFDEGQAERELVKMDGETNEFYIYRRIRK